MSAFPSNTNNAIVETDGAGKLVVEVYNGTGSTIAYGTPKALAEKWATTVGTHYYPIAVATDSNGVTRVGVCLEAGGHLDKTVGKYLVRGHWDDTTTGLTTSGTIAANDQLTIANATPTSFTAISTGSTVGGALWGTGCVGIATVNVTTNKWQLYLTGKRIVVS